MKINHPCGGVISAVPDVDSAADVVRARGGTIVLEPMGSPGCRLAVHRSGRKRVRASSSATT
jgi:predicted enzyme related to lactoylglutathione lyase